MDSVVVFPAPLCPSTTVICPSNMFSVSSFTACRVLLPTLKSCPKHKTQNLCNHRLWTLRTQTTLFLTGHAEQNSVVLLTFVRCLIFIPETSPAGSSSINSPFRAFSASSSSSFSFTIAMRGVLHQYEGCKFGNLKKVICKRS